RPGVVIPSTTFRPRDPMTTSAVRTRIAPSPTGFRHLGTARTALYSWAFARHHGGQFVLRIEDTDVARSTQDSVDQILEAMHWLGLDCDEGPIYQMQRLHRYREVVDQMICDGKAYRCYCTPEELEAMREAQRARGEKTHYDGRWRPEPGKTLAPPPLFGHVPVILGDDGQKLSKRRGAVSVTAYKDAGYPPEAMLNYLARLGWSHGDEELFTREQLVAWFDGSHLSKSPAQWDPVKLNWVNAHYLKTMDEAALAALVADQLARRGVAARPEQVRPLCALFKDRCTTTVELADWVSMYFADVQPSAEDLAAHVSESVKPALAS